MEEIIPILDNLFQRTEAQRILNSFYETSITTLVLKPDKDFTKKSYSTLFLVNINPKILNKILAN